MVIDLMANYEISFIKGTRKFEYKFPQKAANKKGKPDSMLLRTVASAEDNNSDISFQQVTASENP